MSRWEFMRQLEELLSDISPSEREEALQYYNDYINDAGRENEAEAIKSLGTPEQVAQSVKEGLGESFDMGEFTENGFSGSSTAKRNSIVKMEESVSYGNGAEAAGAYESSHREDTDAYSSGTYTDQTTQSGGYTGQTVENEASKKEKLPDWAIVLIVIGCILLSPVLIAAAGTVISVIFGIVAALFGIIIGVAAAAIALVIAGIALVVAGFGGLLAHPLVSVGLVGAGLICLALGILFVMLEVFLCGICLPGIFKGIIYIFKKIFGKKEVA